MRPSIAKTALTASLILLAGSAIAIAKSKAKSAKPRHEPVEVQRSVLSGNEARLAALNFVKPDCTSGPVPDLRIVSAPKNGTYRLEQTSVPVYRDEGNAYAFCNGKPVDARCRLPQRHRAPLRLRHHGPLSGRCSRRLPAQAECARQETASQLESGGARGQGSFSNIMSRENRLQRVRLDGNHKMPLNT